MKTVVTGGAGFIGSHLARALLAEGHEVHVIDNLANGHQEDVPEGATFHQVDILDTADVEEVVNGADVVFHLAALPRVTFSIDHPVETNEANHNGTLSVLMACREGKVGRVVFASSSSLYGNQSILPLVEAMRPHPQSFYALQKATGEELMRLFSLHYALETVSLRFFSVYGTGMRPDGAYALALPKLLASKKEGVSFPIYGDGTQTRDFTHINDIVRGCMHAATSRSVGNGEAINLAAGKSYSINDLADMVGVEKEYFPARPGDAKDTFGDSSLAKKLLDWEPAVTLEDGIAELRKEYGV